VTTTLLVPEVINDIVPKLQVDTLTLDHVDFSKQMFDCGRGEVSSSGLVILNFGTWPFG
jgi:hypothetical protein